ncbi:MAG: hypothetical protein ABI992_09395 [Chthoniobacterales bacterium]
MNRGQRIKPPEICPVCGDEVPPRAHACAECGADHNSGWRTDAASQDALGEAEDDFDYGEFVDREFGSSIKPPGLRLIWWLTAVALLLGTILLFFFTR